MLNDFKPVTLTSYIMKTVEWLHFHLFRPQVRHTLDPLWLAYQEKMDVEVANLCLLHQAYTHLEKGSGAVRCGLWVLVDFFFFKYFSTAFNTIQPRSTTRDCTFPLSSSPYSHQILSRTWRSATCRRFQTTVHHHCGLFQG